MRTIDPLQDCPEPEEIRIRDTLRVIAKVFYFVHMVVAAMYTLLLLILQPRITENFTVVLVLIVIYGLMVFWLILFNLICVCMSKDSLAVWCSRFIVKMLIIIYPIFAVIQLALDSFLNLRSVKAFVIYQCIVSILLIAYQIYSCTCGHHEEPGFIYSHNDLAEHYEEVWRKRREYFENRKVSLRTI